jgi:hypothetical protein
MNIGPITRFSGRTALKLKKHSPQILFYGGIVGTVATTVLASRATLKSVPVVTQLKEDRAALDELTSGINTSVSRDEYSKEVARQYTIAGVELTKHYGPAIVVGVGSIYMLTKSHNQLVARNQALTVAFTGLYETFNRYRGRVRQELGSEMDRQFLHGTVEEQLQVEGKDGKIKTKTVVALDPSSQALLTQMFDSKGSTRWHSAPGYNQSFLDGQQEWCNIVLRKQGFLFLNEACEFLGLPKTQEGNILGWIYKDLSDQGIANDMYVNFGFDQDSDFVGGFKKDVMLEFNIHGPILDLI